MYNCWILWVSIRAQLSFLSICKRNYSFTLQQLLTHTSKTKLLPPTAVKNSWVMNRS